MIRICPITQLALVSLKSAVYQADLGWVNSPRAFPIRA